MRQLSLAHLTVIDMAPPEMIRAAAEIGFDAVGLRLIRVTDTTPGYPLMQDPAALRETLAALADTGLRVNDIEFVRITPDFDPLLHEPFLATGQALGARHVICAPYDPDLSRLAANLARFQAMAHKFGLSVSLEFFPWTEVANLNIARQVVEMAKDDGIGILVDALHFNRSDSQLQDLRDLPASRLPFAHLCDAPVKPPYTTEDLFFAGRVERLPPGEGQIDLIRFIKALPDTVTLGLEVPMTALQQAQGSRAVARRVYGAARALLDRI